MVFLVENWADNSLAPIIGKKVVYVTNNDSCYSYRRDGDVMVRKLEENLTCKHDKADSRMAGHLSKLPPSSTATVRSVDTDVTIIIL